MIEILLFLIFCQLSGFNPWLLSASDRGTCCYVCAKCNKPTEAVSMCSFPEMEVTASNKVHEYKRRPGNELLRLQTRITELENEVSNLRASKI